MGEILVQGNTVMLGYLKDAKATAEAFAGGWMHTGDLAVWHPNNYVEIKDRKKDIIISGGENISSVEVEIALYKHPAVALAAVVARPDEKWGETPCAFVQLKPGATVTEDEIHPALPREPRRLQAAEEGRVRRRCRRPRPARSRSSCCGSGRSRSDSERGGRYQSGLKAFTITPPDFSSSSISISRRAAASSRSFPNEP